MDNKGTQALLLSDISVIKDVVKKNVSFSVSTTDVNGVKQLNLILDAIVPPLIDIPYQKTDSLAKKFGFDRNSLKYKAFALACLLLMPIQAVLSIISVLLIKSKLRAFYRVEALKRVKDCDLIVSYSDENFKEAASLLPLNYYWVASWWSMLISRTWEILIAKSFNKSVVMFPNSVGPFRTWIGRFLSKLSLNNCDYVMIRDPISYDIVNSLGIKSHKILTSDTALLFKPVNENFIGVRDNFSDLVIGVSPGIYGNSLDLEEVRKYVLAHALALDRSIERHKFKVFFLPHFVAHLQHDDLEMCKLIVSEMKNKNRIKIVNAKTVQEFKSYLDQMNMIISSKMHPAILGASGYVPILCIAYDHKQTGFFERLGMIDCTLNIRQVSYETLSSKIDYVWHNREEIRGLLKKHIPVFQKNIRASIKKAVSPYVK
jgi:polysaccharide pyruvyl transferase WcaK-like protein